VTFHKVKGHSDNPGNNRCDELAREAIQDYRRMNGEGEEEKISTPVKEDASEPSSK